MVGKRNIPGLEALSRIDMSIADMRRMVADAISSADSATARAAEVRGAQVAHYKELAEIRLDVVADGVAQGRLDGLHSQARKLLDEHADYVKREGEALDAAARKIKELEDKRAGLAAEHQAAVEAYESRVAEVEAMLKADAAYMALAEVSETAAAVAARAHQKLGVAQADLEEKGKPYKEDKLFSYLWKRKFRTPEYKAGPFIRFMDGWVASIVKYDNAWMNFQRLSQLPEWLEEHAKEQDEKAAAALQALEDAEEDALENAGANALRAKADELLASIRAADQAIDAAEAEHGEIAARHAAALEEEAGPAREALRLLENGLRKESFQDLRTLAAETIDLRDDRIVDALVKLRTEEMSLELETERLSGLPERLRGDLTKLEDLRRRFKAARLDSAYTVVASAAVDEALSGVVSGRIGSDRAFDYISRAVRRIEPQAEPGFGGTRRSQTIGLPPVLGDVIWEIAKEAGRSGGSRGGGISFPTSRSGTTRRSPRINFPSGGGGSRGGGGGRRGGGGFKTGGGF
ncbi:MAG: hypothetical protein R3C13_13055 [Hyphomonas sp.]|uniref:hypothetical protein n=1 Tax=Hyphomonas sp. TaxID=87 RepID=UPI0035290586